MALHSFLACSVARQLTRSLTPHAFFCPYQESGQTLIPKILTSNTVKSPAPMLIPIEQSIDDDSNRILALKELVQEDSGPNILRAVSVPAVHGAGSTEPHQIEPTEGDREPPTVDQIEPRGELIENSGEDLANSVPAPATTTVAALAVAAPGGEGGERSDNGAVFDDGMQTDEPVFATFTPVELDRLKVRT